MATGPTMGTGEPMKTDRFATWFIVALSVLVLVGVFADWFVRPAHFIFGLPS